MQKLISFLFASLFFLLPIIFYPYSSEVFEFNKMVTVYVFTILIVSAWAVRMISQKKFILKQTLLDIPIIVFLLSQILSTAFSIDVHTSIFGYYSRFNGGLLSIISYSLLYWAYVANMDRKKTDNALTWLLASVFFVSVYGILEHFGRSTSCLLITHEFNVGCWVQDVKERVFATMGQPNWLAALLVALSPFVWYKILKPKEKTNLYFWIIVSTGYFLALIFTKSRSGLIGFATTAIIFWAGSFLVSTNKEGIKRLLLFAGVINLIFLICIFIFGTIWTPSVFQIVRRVKTELAVSKPLKPQGPALEVGGTESGKIRKIVWKGAFDLWKKYPFWGSGVETFGFAYYETRPQEHNLVSEWDFLYNKAHNEYLNFLSTTGIIGFSAYLILIAISLFVIIKVYITNLSDKNISSLFTLAVFAGYSSILITNFFGFSVVATNLLLFLLPAFCVSMENKGKNEEGFEASGQWQTFLILVVIVFCLIGLYLNYRYWIADSFFSQSKLSQSSKDYPTALDAIERSIKISPKEALYHDQYARLLADYAYAYKVIKADDNAQEYALAAATESALAFDLSPRNINLQRSRVDILTDISIVNGKYLDQALAVLEYSKSYSPTDAKLFYKAGVSFLRNNNLQKALVNFQKAVDLKPNYLDARLALALSFLDAQEQQKARLEFEYIVTNIDPDHKLAKEELEKL